MSKSNTDAGHPCHRVAPSGGLFDQTFGAVFSGGLTFE